MATHRSDIGEKAVAPDDLLYREAGSGGHRMTHIGMTMLEEARPLRERREDLAAEQGRADWLVATAEALRDRHQVGRDALLLTGVQRPGAAHAAHDLVKDEQHAVAIAARADALAIVGNWRDRARSRAHDGLGHERDDSVRAEFEYLVLKGLRSACRIGFITLPCVLKAVGVASIDVMSFDQQRFKVRATPYV